MYGPELTPKISYENNGKFIQKQPLTDVLQNRCSWKFHKFYRKLPVFESLVGKVAGLKFMWNFIKKRLQHSCFPVKFAKFLRTHPVAASELY